jgi:hypothetical protein
MNTQLRSVSLMLLGNIYKEGHDAQAEKMLATGFAHAAKTCNQIVAVAAGFTLKGKILCNETASNPRRAKKLCLFPKK